MTTEATPPRRGTDPDDSDYRDRRQPITGEEIRVGVGKYSIGLRGANIGSLVIGLIALIILGWHANDQTRATTELTNSIASEHAKMISSIERTMRLQTCVLSLTAQERIQWRESRDAQHALMAYCPSLLLSGPQTP